MLHLTKYLKSLVKVSSCILCLEETEQNDAYIYNQIILESNESITVKELVNFILDKEEYKIDCNGRICGACIVTAINCYTFMKKCRSTNEVLHKLVDKMADCLPEKSAGKSMYVAVNTELDCTLLIDRRQKMKMKHKAYNRAQVLMRNERNFRCDQCHKGFREAFFLKQHYYSCHAPKIHQCQKCPLKFGSVYFLNKHKYASHVERVCSVCGKVYNTRAGLKVHMEGHKERECPKCNKSYRSESTFKAHLKLEDCTKRTPRPREDVVRPPKDDVEHFICHICDRVFTRKYMLNVHIKGEHHNGQTYNCEWCEKRFAQKSQLKAHVVKHTRERKFTCSICCNKFVSRPALVHHIRIHTGEKPFKCNQCDMSFLSKSRRMDHIRRVHIVPSHVCNICCAKFRSLTSLKNHREKHFDSTSKLFCTKISPVQEYVIEDVPTMEA